MCLTKVQLGEVDAWQCKWMWTKAQSQSHRAAKQTTSTPIFIMHTVKHLTSSAKTRTRPFYGSLDFIRDNPGEPVPEKTFTYSHLSWSSIIPYLLLPSIIIHGILPIQFTCLTVFFHNLSPSFLWSTSWPGILHSILNTFLHPIIVFFSRHMSIPRFAIELRSCHLILVSLLTLYLELSVIA